MAENFVNIEGTVTGFLGEDSTIAVIKVDKFDGIPWTNNLMMTVLRWTGNDICVVDENGVATDNDIEVGARIQFATNYREQNNYHNDVQTS